MTDKVGQRTLRQQIYMEKRRRAVALQLFFILTACIALINITVALCICLSTSLYYLLNRLNIRGLFYTALRRLRRWLVSLINENLNNLMGKYNLFVFDSKLRRTFKFKGPREVAKLILGERDPAVRRHIAEKVGIACLIDAIGATLVDKWQTEKWGTYELLRLNIHMRTRPIYLKMTDASTQTTYIEGVPPGITDCRSALKWRCGGLDWDPEQLT